MIRIYRRFNTPVGPVAYALDPNGALTHLTFNNEGTPLETLLDSEGYIAVPGEERCQQLEEQIAEFLSGDRTCFDVLTSTRGTPFQRRVWEALCEIRFGETVGVHEFAREIGHPNSRRAIHAARMANPIRLVVPCHRVIDDTLREVPEYQKRLLEFERGNPAMVVHFPEATGSIEQDRALGYLL